jgi:hypothetical protein
MNSLEGRKGEYGRRLKPGKPGRATRATVSRIERLLDAVLALLCAAILAMMLSSIARTEGVPLALVRTDALRAAGLIFAAVALGSLLKRKR